LLGRILGGGEGEDIANGAAAGQAPSGAQPSENGDQLDLNRATFEDLRDLGFSVTQATRVISYREENQGFDSVSDLGEVPGVPRELLDSVESRLRVG